MGRQTPRAGGGCERRIKRGETIEKALAAFEVELAAYIAKIDEMGGALTAIDENTSVRSPLTRLVERLLGPVELLPLAADGGQAEEVDRVRLSGRI